MQVPHKRYWQNNDVLGIAVKLHSSNPVHLLLQLPSVSSPFSPSLSFSVSNVWAYDS